MHRSGNSTTATPRYDPLGRLHEVPSSYGGTTRFLYDGSDVVAEYNTSGTLLRRYVHGTGARSHIAGRRAADDPLTEVPALGWHVRNWRAMLRHGLKVGELGRFRYTGQAWLPERPDW